MNYIFTLILSLVTSYAQRTNSYYEMGVEEFFNLPEVREQIDPKNFNANLLAASLFHATNKARANSGIPVVKFNIHLLDACMSQATYLVDHNTYGHLNNHSGFERTVQKRVNNRTDIFKRVAENIGQYTILNCPEWIGVRYDFQNGEYEFLNPENGNPCTFYTYTDLAETTVMKWINSPSHRKNLFNPYYTHLGCGTALGPHELKSKTAPYAITIQNFGGVQ